MNNKGFTILELLIAVGIFSIVSVTSVWLVFSSLSLRDQTLASTRAQEQLRVFSQTLRGAIQNSRVVSGGGNTLQLTSQDSCWTFIFDDLLENVRYGQTAGVGCSPDPTPQTSFFAPTTEVSDLEFTITPLSTGGREVRVEGSLRIVLPFDDYMVDFSDTFTNLID